MDPKWKLVDELIGEMQSDLYKSPIVFMIQLKSIRESDREKVVNKYQQKNSLLAWLELRTAMRRCPKIFDETLNALKELAKKDPMWRDLAVKLDRADLAQNLERCDITDATEEAFN